MPELPETETIARDIRELVAGDAIVGFRAPRPDVLRGAKGLTFAKRVGSTRILGAWRRAKTVVIDLASGDRVLVQPRFTGALTVRPAGSLVPNLCVAFDLESGRVLAYADVRRLGTVRLTTRAEFDAFTAALGIEPLDPEFTSDRLSVLLRGTRVAVKSALMQQHRIAGVGNIYANEALWGAGIDPSRPAASLSDSEAARLHAALRDVLSRSIAARGTSFRDYRDGRGERGSFSAQLEVYGRSRQPCRRCGAMLVETHAVDGRTTVFCYRCQC